jgi:pimeloyl-ACP methyl ester carboxylesterase
MDVVDDDLIDFEANGAAPLPSMGQNAYVDHDGARIWCSSYGSGPAVILLHGGLGHSGNWGYQVPFLVRHGYRVVLVDSRGHGRSTYDERPFSYDLMASDVLAVMDELQLEKAALVGWSDGACTSMVLAAKEPSRVTGVFFFACNVGPTGVKRFEMTPTINRCFNRHKKDYAQVSPMPERFDELVRDLAPMQRTQPNYSSDDLARIILPVVIALGEGDEFITREHAEYLARAIPHAESLILNGVSHFAPVQRPNVFNNAILAFLERVLRSSASQSTS